MADTKNTEDLTRLKLPKGGTVTFWKPEELPTRRTNAIEESALALPKGPTRQYQAALTAAKAEHPGLSDDELVEQGHVTMPEYTPEEARRVGEHQRLVIVQYLKSWTHKEPLPQTPDEVLDLPPHDYKAIRAHVQKIQNSDNKGAYDLSDGDEAIEDEESPTGL
jgi:hypothetical protein